MRRRGLSPRPLAILKSSSNATEVSLQIVRMCESETAQQLVLGLPLDKNGTETKQAEIIREFASTLAITCLEYLGPNFSLWFQNLPWQDCKVPTMQVSTYLERG